MAIVTKLQAVPKDRVARATTTEAGYGSVEIEGVTYFVLESYGSPSRVRPNKTSQVFHFDRQHAAELKAALQAQFPGI